MNNLMHLPSSNEEVSNAIETSCLNDEFGENFSLSNYEDDDDDSGFCCPCCLPR